MLSSILFEQFAYAYEQIMPIGLQLLLKFGEEIVVGSLVAQLHPFQQLHNMLQALRGRQIQFEDAIADLHECVERFQLSV